MFSQQLGYVLLQREAIATWRQELTPVLSPGPKPHRSTSDRCGGLTVERKEFGTGEHSRSRFVGLFAPHWQVTSDNFILAFLEGPALSLDDRSSYSLSTEPHLRLE